MSRKSIHCWFCLRIVGSIEGMKQMQEDGRRDRHSMAISMPKVLDEMSKNQLSLIPYTVFLITPPLPDIHTLRGSTSDTHPPNFVLSFPYPDRFLSPSCIDCGPQSTSYLIFLPQGKKMSHIRVS